MPSGSDHLLSIQVTGETTAFVLRPKRPYHDIWVATPDGTRSEVSTLQVEATVMNSGTTPISVWLADPTEHSNRLREKPRRILPGESVPVYAGVLAKFGLSFQSAEDVDGSEMTVTLRFLRPIHPSLTLDIHATWGAP
jgi:hypothetical protein